ncbi:Imm50 family immunity protein [Teredinibacter turnerae]|uniref:Imm50 family immunity protein n=1 Tax=Teredinibacter turnerae TaxID=2426 RepID=UPI000412C1A8|nr:Imm50 family immunity protein [Teredinibacter turnerae]
MHKYMMKGYQNEVVSFFGYWPEFCDSSITNYKNDEDSIQLTLDYIDSDKKVKGTVFLRFTGVSENELSIYESGSVIDKLQITEGDQYRVSIEPCYGLGGSFKCTSVVAEVANA